jgi:hypothetical protein
VSGCLTVREEGVSYDLGGLPPGHVVAEPEVWPVLRWYTRFGIATGVAIDRSRSRQRLYPLPECTPFYHVLERLLAGRWAWQSLCDCYYLGYLSPGHVVVRAEVWTVGGRHAWLAYAAAGVAVGYASGSQPFDELIESGANRYIFEGLGGVVLHVARSIGHYLGKLPSGDIIFGAEARVASLTAGGIAVDDASTGHAAHEVVEG